MHEQESSLPLETKTEDRFSVSWRTLRASLIVVVLAGFGLLWMFTGDEMVPRGKDGPASMTLATTSEQSKSPAAVTALAAPTILPDPAISSAAADALAPAAERTYTASVWNAAAKAAAPAGKTGKIQFAIKPWGEIVIDGKKRGVSPPVKELSVPEGRHRIEIRNSTFSGYAGEVDVKAGRSVSIAHSFTPP
jgi:hypothetical protein